MTYTYAPATGGAFTDRDRVRFHIGDTDPNAVKFTDEEIAAILTEAGDYQAATLACIRNLIAKLSIPDFQADWLKVDSSTARKGYLDLLDLKEDEFGSSISVTAGHTYRPDSRQATAPTFPETPDSSQEKGY